MPGSIAVDRYSMEHPVAEPRLLGPWPSTGNRQWQERAGTLAEFRPTLGHHSRSISLSTGSKAAVLIDDIAEGSVVRESPKVVDQYCEMALGYGGSITRRMRRNDDVFSRPERVVLW